MTSVPADDGQAKQSIRVAATVLCRFCRVIRCKLFALQWLDQVAAAPVKEVVRVLKALAKRADVRDRT